MNWLNLETRMLHSPEFIGCEPTEQATWLKLMMYCASQENGGVIAGCEEWKCRRWQQTCGVMLEEVQSRCDLWLWDDDDLILWGYPAEKEEDVKLKRDAGARGGRKKAENSKVSSTSLAPALADCESATSKPPSETQNTSYGKERKEKKRKEKEAATAASAEAEAEAAVARIGKKIQSLRLSWGFPMTHGERVTIGNDLELFESMGEAEWVTIRDYLRARLPEGAVGWQPIKREKFAQTASDVLQHALWWREKRTPLPSITQIFEKVVVTPEARAEAVADFREVFGRVGA